MINKNEIQYCLDPYDLESKAIEQLHNVAMLPPTIALSVMPDCHPGYGMPIGGVAALDNAVSPNMVGKDIGCGMRAIQTELKVSDVQKFIPEIIEMIDKNIPTGFNVHGLPMTWDKFHDYFEQPLKRTPCQQHIIDKGKKSRVKHSLGTLGGGNHFIELQEDEDGYLWAMIHSGSRQLGELIADYYHAKALELNKIWHTNLPCDNLAFLPRECDEFVDYLYNMGFALEYAKESRKRMMEAVKGILCHFNGSDYIFKEFDVHHNYAALTNIRGRNAWIHRKGAINASEGAIGIIPGSMASKSYIVRGLGDERSLRSCSHGAGRVRSRTASSEMLDIEKCREEMKNIVFSGFKKVTRGRLKGEYDLSESCGAYKDIDEVIKLQSKQIEVLHVLKPLGVVKA